MALSWACDAWKLGQPPKVMFDDGTSGKLTKLESRRLKYLSKSGTASTSKDEATTELLNGLVRVNVMRFVHELYSSILKIGER